MAFSVFSVKNRKIEVKFSKNCVPAIKARFVVVGFFCKGSSCSDCSRQQRVPAEKLRTILKANKKETQNHCGWCSLLKKKIKNKRFPHFCSYIDPQVCVGLLPLASAAGTHSHQCELKENQRHLYLWLTGYFLAIYAAVSPDQTFPFSLRLSISPAHIYLEYWLRKLA